MSIAHETTSAHSESNSERAAAVRAVLASQPAPMVARSIAAFRRDLQELLKTHRGQWVAYRGDERKGFGRRHTPLYQECLRRGLSRDEFIVTLVEPWVLQTNGFVCASDIQSLKAGSAAHSFRLLHMNGWWHVYSSFFGGRAGARVRFPGANNEQWCCADIIAPIRSKQWVVSRGLVLQVLHPRVEWVDPAKIIPSVEMLNARVEMRFERR